LGKEQTLDAVDVFNSFSDEDASLATYASPVLLLPARHPDHRTNARLATLEGEQRTHQRLAIDLVGLGPPTAGDAAIDAASTI